MTNRLNITNNKTSNETSSGRFDSRPFVMQSKSDNSKPSDLKTSLTQANTYGHHLGKTDSTNQSNTTVVQPKLDNQPIQAALGNSRKHKELEKVRKKQSEKHKQPARVAKKPSGKQKQLEELGKKAPGKTPQQILNENSHLRVGKKDPHKSGDHSPSLVNYNKTTDGQIRATGRPHAKNQQGSVRLSIGQNQIPTHHFASHGAESHSTLTSLRAAGGVGEHSKHSTDELLDKTASAYRGTPKLQNGTPIKTHVRRPGTANNSKNNVTSRPVSPYVSQQMINMDMRESVKKGKPEHNSLANKLLNRRRK